MKIGYPLVKPMRSGYHDRLQPSETTLPSEKDILKYNYFTFYSQNLGAVIKDSLT